MKANGIFVTRHEIKTRLADEWKNRNYWQARYINACNEPCSKPDKEPDRINRAKTAMARAIRAEHRARALSDAIALWGGIYAEPVFDYDTPRVPEGYHPVTAVEIEWTPDEKETVEISG